MLIILEGVDKSGKSTLAKELRSLLKWPVIHFGKPGSDPALEYAQFLLNCNEDIICDRFFIGEMVYGPLLRDKRSMSPMQIITIERMCRKIGTILVHVSPPYSIIQDRLTELGDDMVTYEQNQKAYDMFRTVINSVKIEPKTALLWANYKPNVIAKQLKKLVDENKNLWRVASNVCSGIGTTVGKKIVFVGDKVNKNTTWIGQPFDDGPAAKYLLRALILSNINENEIYLTNADKLQAQEIEFLKLTGETRFIALGNIAASKLRFLNTKYELVPHPQYWNRFAHEDINGYVKCLEDAVKGACVYNVNLQRI